MTDKQEEPSIEVGVLLLGTRQEATPLRISPKDVVLSLLQAVEAENPTFVAGLDFSMVRLYPAKHKGKWITQYGPKAAKLKAGDYATVERVWQRELELDEIVEHYFTDLGSGNIHLLVRVTMSKYVLGNLSRSLEAAPPDFVVLWCRVAGAAPTSSFPVIIESSKSVFELMELIKKAAFDDDDDVWAARIVLFEAKDEDGNWLPRFSNNVSAFEEMQQIATESEMRSNALVQTQMLRSIFHSFTPNDLNLMVLTTPRQGSVGVGGTAEEETIEVWVLLVGARQEARPVRMKPKQTIWDLLAAIDAENPTFFAGIDYSMVRLYLAKDQRKWIAQGGPEAAALMAGSYYMVDGICRSEMTRHRTVKHHFTDLGSGNVHLLVRVVMPRPLLGKRSHLLEASSRIDFLVLWCRVAGASPTSTFPVIIDSSESVSQLKRLIKKAVFQDDDEVLERSIVLFEAKDEDGKWLPRFSENVSEFEGIQQNATEPEMCSKALFLTRTLRTIFHSLGPNDLNVMVLTAPRYIVTPSERCSQLTQPYQNVASLLKETVPVKELVSDIGRVSSLGDISPYLTPFLVLQNSAGTGKTQMAFNLMAREDIEVFYIDCGDKREPVQQAFLRRSQSFWRCVERDLPKVEDASMFDILPQFRLFTFGFIWALLSGCPSFIHPRMPTEIWDELDTRPNGSRQNVIFLDNFPRVDNSRLRTSEVALRFMLNVFRTFGLPVILSATNGAARDLAAMDFGRDAGNTAELWSIIRPNLPRFNPSSNGATFFRSHPTASWLRDIIDNSRPSFARVAMKFTEANPLSARAFNQFMDALAKKVAHTCADSNAFASEAFRVGQLNLFLGASYGCDVDTVPVDDTSLLISDHFARLRETSPFELVLGCKSVPCKLSERTITPWRCYSAVPTIEEDCLLHLCLSGGRHFEALRDSNGAPIPFVRAFVNVEDIPYSVLNCIKAKQPHYAHARLEMLVAGAVVMASHRNGLAGIKFSSFFTALLYELGIQTSRESKLRIPDAIAETVEYLTIPFLASPGLGWPAYLKQTPLNLGALTIEKNEIRTRICALDGVVSVECYNEQLQLTVDTVKSILQDIPNECAIHVVVMKSLQSFSYRQQDKNRKARMETMLKGLDLLHHAHFYRLLASKDRADQGVSRAELVPIRYMKNECRAVVCSEKPSCKVKKVVIFLEFPEAATAATFAEISHPNTQHGGT